MRRNDGRSTFRRCANSVLSDVPLYSSPLRSSRSEKLMFEFWYSTPSSFSNAMKRG